MLYSDIIYIHVWIHWTYVKNWIKCGFLLDVMKIWQNGQNSRLISVILMKESVQICQICSILSSMDFVHRGHIIQDQHN